MQLTVLGSGGWIPRSGRATTSLALRIGPQLVVFDAGTGIARLLEPRFEHLLPDEGPVHIFLSHLHLDHTVGLTFLPALWKVPTVIHVPAVAAGELGPREVLDRLVGPPFFPHTLADFPMEVEVRSLQEGSVRLERGEVAVRRQRHPGGSVGFRIGHGLAFMTDTVHDPEAASFVRGVQLLVHEAWIRGDEESEALRRGLQAHTSARAAAQLATSAGVGELLLSHLTPLRGLEYHREMLEVARQVFPETALCEDGLTRDVPEDGS